MQSQQPKLPFIKRRQFFLTLIVVVMVLSVVGIVSMRSRLAASNGIAAKTPAPSPQSAEEWLKSCDWEIKDPEIAAAGFVNTVNGETFLQSYTANEIKEVPSAEVSLDVMEKTPRKYVGTLVTFRIDVSGVIAQVPSGEKSETAANGGKGAELVGYDFASMKGYTQVVVLGSACDQYDSSHQLTITGLVIGYISGHNTFNDPVRNIVVYTTEDLITDKREYP